jgi:hypothetical protein
MYQSWSSSCWGSKYRIFANRGITQGFVQENGTLLKSCAFACTLSPLEPTLTPATQASYDEVGVKILLYSPCSLCGVGAGLPAGSSFSLNK